MIDSADILLTLCPVVRTEADAGLVRLVDRDGYGDMTPMRFKRDLIWVRETEGFFIYNHKSSPISNDFHGFMTSIVPAMKSVAQIPYSATTPLEVFCRIIDRPCVACPPERLPADWVLNGRSAYLRARSDWARDDGKAEGILGQDRLPGDIVPLPYLEAEVTEIVVWSSQYSLALNAHAMKNLDSYRP